MKWKWETCVKVLTTAAEGTIRTQRNDDNDDWFDEECREITRRKNQAYLIMQQGRRMEPQWRNTES